MRTVRLNGGDCMVTDEYCPGQATAVLWPDRKAGIVRRLVDFPMHDGGSVVVEVDDDAAGGGVRAGGGVTRGWPDRRVVEQAQQSFEQAVGRVQPAVQAMLGRLRALADAPDEVQVEFGVQLSAEAGAFVAAASSTGNFRVSMTWRSPPGQSARGEGLGAGLG